MQTDENEINNESLEVLDKELDGLIEQALKVGQEIKEGNKKTEEALDSFDQEVESSIREIEKNLKDLDQIEKEAGDELDRLILEESEELAKE